MIIYLLSVLVLIHINPYVKCLAFGNYNYINWAVLHWIYKWIFSWQKMIAINMWHDNSKLIDSHVWFMMKKCWYETSSHLLLTYLQYFIIFTFTPLFLFTLSRWCCFRNYTIRILLKFWFFGRIFTVIFRARPIMIDEISVKYHHHLEPEH